MLGGRFNRSHGLSGTTHRAQDAHVGAATAEIGTQRLPDRLIREVRVFCSKACARMIMPAMQ